MEKEAYVKCIPSIEIPPLFSEDEHVVTVTVDRKRSVLDSIIASTHPKREMRVDLRSLLSIPKGESDVVDVVFFKYDEEKTTSLNHIQQFIDPSKKEGLDFSIWYPTCFSFLDIDAEMKRRGLGYDPIAVAVVYESQLIEFERTNGTNQLESITLWKTESGWHKLQYDRDGKGKTEIKPLGFWEGRTSNLSSCGWVAGVRKK